MLRNVETWKGEYSFSDGKGRRYTNIVKTEKLTENIFLEFGKRKNSDYHYVSLMQGDYRKPKQAQQLFFTHYICGKWYVYDNEAIHLVEPYKTKKEAVQRLRQLGMMLLKMTYEQVIEALKETAKP